MSIRALLVSLVGLLVFVFFMSFLMWFESSTGPKPEEGDKSFLALPEAYGNIPPVPTATRTPTRTATRTVTPTPTNLPSPNKYVDVNRTGGTHDGNSWENAYTEIATAISNAPSGGVIYVAEGTYGYCYTSSKSLTIFGGFRVNHSTFTAKRDPEHFVTKVRPVSYYAPAFTLNNGSSTVVLDGLTIADAHNNGSGGAIRSYPVANLTVRNCIIQGNASNDANCDGGGVYLQSTTVFLFENCKFKGNSAGRNGGAVAITSCSAGSKAFKRCVFEGNLSSANPAYGGAVYSNGVSVDYTNCLFVKNAVTTSGAALYITGSGTSSINHCTLSMNGTSGGSVVAVYQDDPSVLNISNSVIYWNYHSSGTQLTYEAQTKPVTYSCIGGTMFVGTGNKSTDPFFYRKELDWHLRPDSPCLNAADPNSYQTVLQDLSGYSRDNAFGARFDMGCYEWPDPRFFGVVEQVLPSPFSFRVKPGFPENIAEPFFVVPEAVDEYINALDDLGIKSIEIFIPWAMIEVLPGPKTGTPECPLFADPIYLWDDNGNYNEAEIEAVTPDDWNYHLQNPYDQWDGGTPVPVWPKSDLEEGRLNTTYHTVANLGYMKIYLQQWAEYMQSFMNTLHDHGIEIAAAIEQAPAWRVTIDPDFPYANALNILDCNDTTLQKLRWFTTLFFNKYMQGPVMSDASAGYPGIQQFASYFENQFPFVDLYTAWQEIEFNFVRTNTTGINYRHEECWDILKAIKSGVSNNSDNNLYINVFEAFSDNKNKSDVPIARVHLDYIHGLIDQAGNEMVGSGTPTPLPIDKVRQFRETVKIIGINIAHGIGGEDSVVEMNPDNTAKRGLNRLDYSFSDKYGDSGFEVNLLDQFEVWNQQNSVYRGCNKERGPWRFEPLIDQMDNPDDQQWAAKATYQSSTNYLRHIGISRSRYTYSLDTHIRNPIDWCDSGLLDHHFSTAEFSNDISNQAPVSWVHPLTGIEGGGTGNYDYHYGSYLTHYPAYYALKCFRRNLDEPSIPSIISFIVTQSNGVPGSIVYNDQSLITVTVNLSDSVYGNTSLLIDGLSVASYYATPSSNQINFY